MNLEKLKDTARKYEQKEDWRKAIEVYLKAIQQIESGAESSPDLSLYNRVGDLYLKTSDTAAAVRSYERAVDLYADQGFFNNAIALCGKILRVNPGRTQTYLKLAQLHARKNVVIEAKRNLIEFLERMNALGQLDLAFQSVKEFADQFSGSQEIRIMLVELLRASSREDEAQEQLDKLVGELEARGDRIAAQRAVERIQAARAEEPSAPLPPRAGGLVFLDTGMDLPTSPPVRPDDESPPLELADATPPDGLIIDPLASVNSDEAVMLPGLERTPELDMMESAGLEIEPLELERSEPTDLHFEGVALEGMDEPPLGSGEVELSDPLLDAGDELLVSETVDLDFVESGGGSTLGLPLIQLDDTERPSIMDLENRILDDPDDPELHRALGERLLPTGEELRALEELELALAGYEDRQDWSLALTVADRLVAVAPENIRYHQKRVELAYRRGDRAPLLDAYLELAEALARAGATEKAIAVYRRVQEHDPGNSRAARAVATLGAAPRAPAPPAMKTIPAAPAPSPPAPSPPPAPRPVDDPAFVDLGSMIFDESAPRDTRMRVERREPQHEDEQREFKEILEQFKRGIEENLDNEDYQAHYDLGVAFKEMGLFDEAIAEFQKALRAPEGRLRTSEALGICFFDKGQLAISETVLRRAVDTAEGGDDARLGLLYWLGRACEGQGKDAEAITSYERALAVDIRFMDLSERIQRLTAGRQE
ncbi:MAG: tetratricopeptide repeat protein [Gemmatimonadales bacterium]